MKTRIWKFIACAGAVALAFAVVPGAAAQCGLPAKPMSWHPQIGSAQPSLLRTDYDRNSEPSIVGMWHVVFTFSDGSQFDNSVVQWHADGTEIMNSSRPAQDGNFCLGVWKQIGSRKYILNHLPWKGYDPTGALQDGAQLVEQVTLSRDGNSYTGSFTFTPYDNSGNAGPTFTGTMVATRITPSTPFTDLL
jgi:hypothetical protein